MMFGLTSDRCEDTQKKVSWNFPGLLTRENDFWVVHPKWLDQNLAIRFFGCLSKKAASNFQSSWLLCLASEKSHVDPATQFHPISKTIFLGGGGATAVSLRKKLDSGTQTSLFKSKNPVKKYTTGFDFLQWPKVSSTITVPIKITKQEVFVPLPRKIYSRRATHVQEKSIPGEQHRVSKKAPGLASFKRGNATLASYKHFQANFDLSRLTSLLCVICIHFALLMQKIGVKKYFLLIFKSKKKIFRKKFDMHVSE